MNAEELHHRIKNVIILLADGHSLKVGDLTFACTGKNHFSVTGWTLKNDLMNVTKQSAFNRISRHKNAFY